MTGRVRSWLWRMSYSALRDSLESIRHSPVGRGIPWTKSPSRNRRAINSRSGWFSSGSPVTRMPKKILSPFLATEMSNCSVPTRKRNACILRFGRTICWIWPSSKSDVPSSTPVCPFTNARTAAQSFSKVLSKPSRISTDVRNL